MWAYAPARRAPACPCVHAPVCACSRVCSRLAGFCPRCLGQEVGLADARRKVHQTAGCCIDFCRLSGCKSKSRNRARHLGLQLHSSARFDLAPQRVERAWHFVQSRLPVRSRLTLLAHQGASRVPTHYACVNPTTARSSPSYLSAPAVWGVSATGGPGLRWWSSGPISAFALGFALSAAAAAVRMQLETACKPL